MIELFKILRDAVGVRPIIPLVLIAISALLFKATKEYPIRELLNDRWFLLLVLLICTGAIAHLIFTSNLAERTYTGRQGVYVARLKGDPTGTLQTRLIEYLRATLSSKANSLGRTVEIRDLKREIGTDDVKEAETIAPGINASAIIWGTAIDENSCYTRTWVKPSKFFRSNVPVNLTQLPELASYTDQIWAELSILPITLTDEPPSTEKLKAEIAELKTDVDKLRAVMNTTGSVRVIKEIPAGLKSFALLVGINEYNGQIPSLLGPVNDVTSLVDILTKRGCEVTTLVNKQVTVNSINDEFMKAIGRLEENDTFIFYFSGHTGIVGKNQSNFVLSDGALVPVTALFRSMLDKHKKCVFIVDGGYNTSELNSIDTSKAAILSADPSGQGVATESNSNGQFHGVFTWAFCQALLSEPQGISARIDELFTATSRLLTAERVVPQPAIIIGDDPPTIK